MTMSEQLIVRGPVDGEIHRVELFGVIEENDELDFRQVPGVDLIQNLVVPRCRAGFSMACFVKYKLLDTK